MVNLYDLSPELWRRYRRGSEIEYGDSFSETYQNVRDEVARNNAVEGFARFSGYGPGSIFPTVADARTSGEGVEVLNGIEEFLEREAALFGEELELERAGEYKLEPPEERLDWNVREKEEKRHFIVDGAKEGNSGRLSAFNIRVNWPIE